MYLSYYYITNIALYVAYLALEIDI